MNATDENPRSPAIIPPRTVSTPIGGHNDDGKIHEIIERALHEITQLSPPRQAAVGGLSGIAAGYCFAKASKIAAFAIGASILGLAVANQTGYIDIHFDRIRDTAQRQLNNVQRAAILTRQQPTTTNVDGEDIETFIDQSPNSLTDSLKRFAFANLAITSSFIGGFLIGVAFE